MNSLRGPLCALLVALLAALPVAARHSDARPLGGAPLAPVAAAGMSPTARAYLTAALDFMQQHSVRRAMVDWPTVRRQAFALAGAARTTADTYPAIRYAVAQLGDHHSEFFTPAQVKAAGTGRGVGLLAIPDAQAPDAHEVVEVFQGGSAAAAGVRVGDRITAIDGVSTAPMTVTTFFAALEVNIPPSAPARPVRLTLQRLGQAQPLAVTLTPGVFDPNRTPRGRRLMGGIGYLDLPALQAANALAAQYATIAQQAIRAADQPAACGWVVDLRRNTGGTELPMLLGVGPILGEGVFARQGPVTLSYRHGAVLRNAQVIVQLRDAYRLQEPAPPVAVLTSGLTASSGEAIVVAFRGRPRTRGFGEPTAGVPTINTFHPLSDGAYLNLTTADDVDRAGRSYDAAIAPDRPVAPEWTFLGTARDPALQAALAWLHRQAGCPAA